MSQEKVDRYKKQKYSGSRKNEDAMTIWEKLGITVVCLIVVGWIGYSAYGVATRSGDDEVATTTEMDITAMTDYLQSLNETAE